MHPLQNFGHSLTCNFNEVPTIVKTTWGFRLKNEGVKALHWAPLSPTYLPIASKRAFHLFPLIPTTHHTLLFIHCFRAIVVFGKRIVDTIRFPYLEQWYWQTVPQTPFAGELIIPAAWFPTLPWIAEWHYSVVSENIWLKVLTVSQHK